LAIEQLADGQVDQLDAAAFSFPDGSIAFDPHRANPPNSVSVVTLLEFSEVRDNRGFILV
jgi:hypothetical protein